MSLVLLQSQLTHPLDVKFCQQKWKKHFALELKKKYNNKNRIFGDLHAIISLSILRQKKSLYFFRFLSTALNDVGFKRSKLCHNKNIVFSLFSHSIFKQHSFHNFFEFVKNHEITITKWNIMHTRLKLFWNQKCSQCVCVEQRVELERVIKIDDIYFLFLCFSQHCGSDRFVNLRLVRRKCRIMGIWCWWRIVNSLIPSLNISSNSFSISIHVIFIPGKTKQDWSLISLVKNFSSPKVELFPLFLNALLVIKIGH